MTGFLLASVGCGLAIDPSVLLLARVAQGLEASVVLPQSLGVMRTVFPPQLLGRAFGIYGPLMGFRLTCPPVKWATRVRR